MSTFKIAGKALLAIGAVLMLAAPAVAGKGYGPGDGTGTRSQPRDGSGHGPGDCSTLLSQPDASPLLSGKGKGGGYGPGDGSGTGTGPKDGSGYGPGTGVPTTLSLPLDAGLLAGKAAKTGAQNGSADRTRSKDASCQG